MASHHVENPPSKPCPHGPGTALNCTQTNYMKVQKTKLKPTGSEASETSGLGTSSGCDTQVVIPPNPHSSYLRSNEKTIYENPIKQNLRSANTLRIGAWNVRTLRQIGKLEMLKLEMARLELSILGISEMRWPQRGDFWSGDYRVIHSGNEPTDDTAGVGVVLDKKLGKLVDTDL